MLSADLILGADITYSSKLNLVLFPVLLQACAGGAVALLSHDLRERKETWDSELMSYFEPAGVRCAALPAETMERCPEEQEQSQGCDEQVMLYVLAAESTLAAVEKLPRAPASLLALAFGKGPFVKVQTVRDVSDVCSDSAAHAPKRKGGALCRPRIRNP